MTNRRSILSSLCAGALALFAPVAAWAGRRREMRPEALRLGAVGPASEVERPPLVEIVDFDCLGVHPAGDVIFSWTAAPPKPLLPCPFCGSTELGFLVESQVPYPSLLTADVICRECRVMVSGATWEKACDRWNWRAGARRWTPG